MVAGPAMLARALGERRIEMETPNEPIDPCQAEEAAWRKARQELDLLKGSVKATTSPLGPGDRLGTFSEVKAASAAIAAAKLTVSEAERVLDACRLAHRPGAMPSPRTGSGG
jgi:hypothetical protein